MKANELMLGDLLRFKKVEGLPDKYIAVHAIKFDYNFSKKYLLDIVFCDSGNVQYNYNPSIVEPIPLTPEILEKNGWISKRDGSGDFIYMRENTPGYGSNDMTVTRNIIGNFQMIHGSFNGISVHYVHELQHALRMCVVDKEITLL